MAQRGQFITLEGSEGAGKSTNLDAICEYLGSQNIDYYCTREPGGTPLAEALRENLLAHWQESIDGLTELLVVFAARNQHVKQEIEPRLQRGQWVVCDRFTDASYAYQSYGRGVAEEYVSNLEKWVQGQLRPDLTLYLDLDPAIGMARIAEREQDRLEQEKSDFFKAVRRGYLRQAEQHKRIKVIDASNTLAEVRTAVRQHLQSFVQQNPAQHNPGQQQQP